MANVLTNLAADIYVAADIVGRELVGMIPSVTINANGSDRVAKGDTVRSAFTRPATVNTTYAPSMTIPEGTDQTVDNKTLTLDTYASVQIPWTGEDMKHVDNGVGFQTVFGDQIAQAMRAITNTIETSLWTAARAGASRAFGTAGTTPFGSNFNEVAEVRQILVDNGCPINRQNTLVVNTLAGTKLRNLAQLQKVNEAGGPELLRQGTLLDLQGLFLKESAAPVAVTKGTGSAYETVGAFPVGSTSITVDTGTGTILAGDVITFAGDTNKYVVNTALTGGVVVIGAPGLRVAAADNTVITVGNSATANLAFHKTAIELVMRPVAVPMMNGRRLDAAADSMTIQDPHSGLVFDITMYGGYQKAMIEIGTLYGQKAWKPNHIAQLLG